MNYPIPIIRPISTVSLPEYDVRYLENGIKLIVINGGKPEVFKLETIFNAGRFYEDQALVANTTLRIMREGAKGYTSDDISEIMDFHGAQLSTSSNFDCLGLTLYGLNKDFEKLLPIYTAILSTPSFVEEELVDYIQERKQSLKVDLTKTDVVAYREVTEAIFGSNHPYGYNSTEQLYDTLHIAKLRQHYEQHYVSGNCTIILSGKVNDAMIQLLEKELIPSIKKGTSTPKIHTVTPNSNQQIYINKPNAVQTAIRIGRGLFNRTHEDFFGLYMLNVVLGDYFSSRLMRNIREDKGYTYHIYSMLDMLKHDGSFLVATETANEYAKDTLAEIYKEFDILQQELIPENELQMAKSYTLGAMLTMLDGPFNVTKVVKDLQTDGVGRIHFEQLIQTIQDVDSNTLLELAQKYLNKSDMYEVMVGKV